MVTVCGMIGAGLYGLHELFRPALDPVLAGLIDPANITLKNCAFASLRIVGPVWLAAYLFDANRRRKQAVLKDVELVEDAMERMKVGKQDRITIRRKIAHDLADAVTRNASVDVIKVANAEMPGLVERKE